MSNQECEDKQEIYATLVEINQEPTELYKILKFENLVSGGGEAKLAISEGYVTLNGEVETRKRKKVYAGDLIQFNEQYFQIALKGDTQAYPRVDSPLSDKVESETAGLVAQSKQQVSEDKKENTSAKAKNARKSIRF